MRWLPRVILPYLEKSIFINHFSDISSSLCYAARLKVFTPIAPSTPFPTSILMCFRVYCAANHLLQHLQQLTRRSKTYLLNILLQALRFALFRLVLNSCVFIDFGENCFGKMHVHPRFRGFLVS